MEQIKRKEYIFLAISFISILIILFVFVITKGFFNKQRVRSRAKTVIDYSSLYPKVKISQDQTAPSSPTFQSVLTYSKKISPNPNPKGGTAAPSAEGSAAQTASSNELHLGYDPKPSLNGFSEDIFSGAVTASLSIDIPTSPGGFAPKISLSYSSSSADDSHLGLNVHWKDTFLTQASWVGQGWSFSGLGEISITQGSWDRDSRQYRLSFPGGSFDLYRDKTGGTNQWRTNPDSKISIVHSDCNAYDVIDICPWEVRTQDGTIYTFGGSEIRSGSSPVSGFTNNATVVSVGKTLDGKNSIWFGKRWLLTEVQDIHRNIIEVAYEKEERTLPCVPTDWHPNYQQAVYPKEIKWGKNEEASQDFRFKIALNRSARDDKQIEQELCTQFYFGNEKLDNIQVKILKPAGNPTLEGDWQLYKKYQLAYEYKTTGSYGQKVNLLLNSFQQLDINGQPSDSLPAYTFSYLAYTGFAQYLQTINNGYGGIITYDYDSITVDKLSCPDHRDNCYASISPEIHRVKTKTIENGQGSSQTITYDYTGSTPRAFATAIHNPDFTQGFCQEHPTSTVCSSSYDNYEFLGFDKASVLVKDYSNNLTTKTTNYYYQLNPDCVAVHPARGKAYKVEAYDNNSKKVRKTETIFGIYDANSQPGNLSSFCTPSYNTIPYIAERQILSYVVDPANENNQKITKIESSDLDFQGHFQRTVDWGEVDASGNDLDINDTKMSWTNYLWEDSYKIGKPESMENYKGSQRSTANLLNLVYFQYRKINITDIVDIGDLIATDTFRWSGNPSPNLPTHLNPQGTILITTRQDFDSYGNKKSVTDAENHTTTTDYDDFYNARVVKVTDPYQDTIETHYGTSGSLYQILGLPNEVVDQNHQATFYTFDSFGRLLTRTNPTDQGGQPTQQVFYNKDAQGKYIVNTQTRKDQGGTNPASYVSSWAISNGLGETIQTQADGDNRLIITNTSYNSQGKVENQSLPHEGDLAQAGSFQTPNWSKVTNTTYDSFGRPRVVTNPDGTTAETVYDDFQRTTTNFDAMRHKAVSYADARGNTVRVESYTGTGEPYSLYSTTRHQYDIQGRLTNIFDNNNNETKMVYDSLGKVIERTDPDLGRTLYPEYDKNGNLLLQQDARGKRIRFEYDNLNRMIKKTWLDERSKQFTFDYGHTGGITSNNRIGKLVKRTDPNGNFWEATNFDANGRLKEEKYHLYGEDYPFSYSYDSRNRMTNLTYPDNEQIVYLFKNEGLSQVSSPTSGTILVNDTVYTINGQINSQKIGNNMTKSYAYHPQNLRLISATTQKGDSNLLSYSYSYYPNGNVERITDKGETALFTYDDFSRLTSVTGSNTASYTYDSLGNITNKVEEGPIILKYDNNLPAHAPKTIQIPAPGLPVSDTEKLSYDEVGNLKAWQGENYQIDWDSENKPTRIKKDRTEVNFEYDGNGNRIKKEILGGDRTIYIGSYLEKNLSKKQTTKYYFTRGQRIAFQRSSSPSTLYYIHTDHLSSTTLVTDQQGNEVARYNYYPYGSFRSDNDQGLTTNSYFFTGQIRDVETGLDYFTARYYSPKLGRFISADPKGNGNRYAYVDNNPVGLIDPNGQESIRPGDMKDLMGSIASVIPPGSPMAKACFFAAASPVIIAAGFLGAGAAIAAAPAVSQAAAAITATVTTAVASLPSLQEVLIRASNYWTRLPVIGQKLPMFTKMLPEAEQKILQSSPLASAQLGTATGVGATYTVPLQPEIVEGALQWGTRVSPGVAGEIGLPQSVSWGSIGHELLHWGRDAATGFTMVGQDLTNFMREERLVESLTGAPGAIKMALSEGDLSWVMMRLSGVVREVKQLVNLPAD